MTTGAPVPPTQELSPAEFVIRWHGTYPDLTEFGGYYGPDFPGEVLEVATAIEQLQRDSNVQVWPVNLSLTLDCSPNDGVIGIDSAVAVADPRAFGFFLSRYAALDNYTTERKTTGLAAAVAITEALVLHSEALVAGASALDLTI
jgi:hypothetical protein